MLEIVQRRTTRMTKEQEYLLYDESLRVLKLLEKMVEHEDLQRSLPTSTSL